SEETSLGRGSLAVLHEQSEAVSCESRTDQSLRFHQFFQSESLFPGDCREQIRCQALPKQGIVLVQAVSTTKSIRFEERLLAAQRVPASAFLLQLQISQSV